MKPFIFKYKVTLDDLDFMNVVGHIQWLTILHKARVEALEHAGYPLQKVYDQGHAIVVGEMSIQYRKAPRFGDLLEITVTTTEPFKYGFVVEYDARNATTGDRLVTAKVKLMFVTAKGRACEMPTDFRTALLG